MTKNHGFAMFIFCTLWFVSISNSYSQQENLLFRHITVKDGLSNANVNCMLQDSDGFMWFGTEEGLNKFDGKDFTVYSVDLGTKGFSANYIRDLFEDKDKNLWISSSYGLVQYDRTKEVFTSYLANDTVPGSISENKIRVGIEDHEGLLWFGTNSGKVNIYNKKTQSFSVFSCEKGTAFNKNNSTIKDIYEDDIGNIWVLYDYGSSVDIINTNRDSVFSVSLISEDSNMKTAIAPNNIIQDGDKNYWITTVGSGLFKLVKTKEGNYTFAQFLHNSNDSESLAGNRILSIWEDVDYGIWLGIENGGLSYYHPKKNTFVNHVHNPYDDLSLSSSSVWSIYQDNEKGLWVSTYSTGINYSKKSLRLFKHEKNNLLNENSLSGNIVTSFLTDSKGVLWVGTDATGLNRYDSLTGQFIRYNTANSNISSNNILALFEDSKHNLWIGTWGGGLNVFDRENETFKSYSTKNTNIIGNNFKSICEDKYGRLWFGSFWGNGGLCYYDSEENSFHSFTTKNSNMPHNTIYKIISGSDGYLWLATHRGLVKFDPLTKLFTTYANSATDVTSISHTNVHCVIETKDSLLWMGTASGLNSFDRKTGIFTRYHKETSGLPHNNIHSIQEDEQGNLWISTKSELAKFNTKTDRFITYTASDGLQDDNFYQGSSYKGSNNELYFGGMNGYNHFNPQNIKEEFLKPKLYFREIKIFNKTVDPGTVNSPLEHKGINSSDKLVLSHNQSVITIDYGALNFDYPNKMKFAYKLDGFEKEWNFVDSKQSATYTNLDPGTYVFKVKIPYNKGVENEEGISLTIIISPPYYMTWWFRILVFSFVIGSLLAFFYQRFRIIKRANKTLEKKVESRTHEINQQKEELLSQAEMLISINTELEHSTIELNEHKTNLEGIVKDRTSELEKAKEKAEESDRLKSAFLANMSHEIRTPMNAIVGFSNLLKESEISKDMKSSYIAQITSNSNSLLVLIDDILDLSMIESDLLSINKQVFALNVFMDEIFLDSTLRHKGAELILTNTIIDQNYLLHSDNYRIKQILINLINNACKFTSSKGRIEFACNIIDNELVFSVIDSGIGIAAENLKTIFNSFSKITDDRTNLYRGAGLGLAISKKIAIILNAKLEVQSELGKGSVFLLKLPADTIVKSKQDITTNAKQTTSNWENRSILVVEDEEANFAYLESALKSTFAKVVWVENGKQAVDLFIENNKFDLVLMDIKMPIMNGHEATKAIKEKYPEQIIIAQTAYARAEDYEEMKNTGFDDCLIKPIIPEKLYAMLGKYL